jgi:hypothetical protein
MSICASGRYVWTAIFQVDAKQIKGKTAAQEGKMRRALMAFEKVMNDELFQKELLDLKFYSDTPDDPNRNLTDEQVVKKIYAAQEHYTSEENNKADIYWLSKKRSRWVTLFTGCSVLGFGDEENKEVYTYSCFLDGKDTELTDIVGHIAHEWTHKLGFVHQYDDHPRRNETVSYAFGILVSKHAEKYTKLYEQ